MRKVVFTAIFLLCATICIFVYNQSANQKINFSKYSEGKDGESFARRYLEFMMQRDPKTNSIPDNIFQLEQVFAARLPKRTIPQFYKNNGKDYIESISWQERGPRNVGGRTGAFGIDIADTNIILAAGVSSGLWKSNNRGASWTKTTSSSQLHSIFCLTQDIRSGHSNTWYAGTGEALSASPNGGGGALYRGDGIYKSTDNGNSWNLLTSTVSGTPQSTQRFDYVYKIAIDPSNLSQEEIYAATTEGILRSSDGGTNWTLVLGSPGTTNGITDVAISSTGVVYAIGEYQAFGGTGSIHRSTDGINWIEISPTTEFDNLFGRGVLAIAPSNENIVYVLLYNALTTPNRNSNQIWSYNYIDGNGTGLGGSWVNKSIALPTLEATGSAFNSGSGIFLYLKVKPDDLNFILLGGDNLFRSTDGFQTLANTKWIGGYDPQGLLSTYPNHHPDILTGSFSPTTPNVYYSGHDGGISKTYDITSPFLSSRPITWISLNNGYNTTQLYSVSMAPEASADLILGGFQDNGNWYSNASGLQDWYFITSGDGCYAKIPPASDNRIYYSVQWGTIVRNDFTLANDVNMTPSSAQHQTFVNPFILDPNNSSMLYYAGGNSATTTGIWRCSNAQNAVTTSGWTYLNGTDVGSSTDQVSALGISTQNNADVLYFGTTEGRVRRIDNAQSATPVVSNINSGLPSGGYVSCIAVDPQNSNKACVIYSNYNFESLWYTTNGGNSWINVEGDLAGATGPSIRWGTIFYVDDIFHVFLASSTGVYYTNSFDGASTVWTQEGVNTIGNVVVTMLDYRASDKTLAAATMGRGVFTTQFASALPVELFSFTGKFENGFVELNWETKTEWQNYGFDIERQNNGQWQKIGFVSGSGSSNSAKHYTYKDNLKDIEFNNMLRYRLKQIDISGNTKYSNDILITALSEKAFLSVQQNYPNPFNSFTEIKFMLSESAPISVLVYNSLGEKVKTLFEGLKESGIHRIELNCDDMASGIYFYEIKSGNHKEIRKLVVAK